MITYLIIQQVHDYCDPHNTLGLINSLQFLGFENVIISKFYFWDFNSHDDFTGPLIIPIIEGLLYYDLKKE